MKILNSILPLLMIFLSCSKISTEGTELKHYSINTIEGVITGSDVRFDKEVSSDGNGSLKIISEEPKVVQLYETGNIDVEDAKIIYNAKVKTENIIGQVYLEMWCVFNGKGEYFSRGLDKSLAGTNDWKKIETAFYLKSGENPDNIKLNIVIAGTGTVWIDDLKLIKM